MRIYTTFLFLLTIAPYLPAQTRYYVNATATGQATGLSWADAFTDLQVALMQAQSGDEIWVAQGEYLPTADGNRDSSFRMAAGVRLYGGFAGTETLLGERDWETNPTVLSGDIGVSGDSTDNSYNILYLENPDSLTIVDGLILRGGQADYPLGDIPLISRKKSGAALYIMAEDGEAYNLIENCRFERNYARGHGGAVYINGSNGGSVAPTFRRCVFAHNRAQVDGGGLARNGSSWIEREDFSYCTFQNNTAGRNGGGLFFDDEEREDTLSVENCIFYQNYATNAGGAAYLFAGRWNKESIKVIDSEFIKNTSFKGILTIENFKYYERYLITGCIFIDNEFTQENSVNGDVFLSGGSVDNQASILIIDNKFFNSSNRYLVNDQTDFEHVVVLDRASVFFCNNNMKFLVWTGYSDITGSVKNILLYNCYALIFLIFLMLIKYQIF